VDPFRGLESHFEKSHIPLAAGGDHLEWSRGADAVGRNSIGIESLPGKMLQLVVVLVDHGRRQGIGRASPDLRRVRREEGGHHLSALETSHVDRPVGSHAVDSARELTICSEELDIVSTPGHSGGGGGRGRLPEDGQQGRESLLR
jgi:hypothetical protein